VLLLTRKLDFVNLDLCSMTKVIYFFTVRLFQHQFQHTKRKSLAGSVQCAFLPGFDESLEDLQKCQSSHIYCNTLKFARLLWYLSKELISFFYEDASKVT